MPKNHLPLLSRSGVLLALISAGFAGEAGAAAARVDFAVGSATVQGSDGRERPLVKGIELDKGDTVRTNDGRTQLRFTDGSYVSLQPNTEFGIKEYNFDGKTDGSEQGFFSLVKGAMRTVTGAIGRVNRNRYQIATPTATIGIRGTGGRIEVLLDGSTLVAGTSGIWTLSNPSGTIDVPAGTFGKAPSAPDQPPQQTSEQPQTGPAPIPPLPTGFKEGESVKTTLIAPLVSGSGYATALAFSNFNNPALESSQNATAVFDPRGRLTDVSLGDGQIFKLDPLTGKHPEFGTDGILAWGRWTGAVTGLYNCDGLCSFNETYDGNRGFHYVIGMPTPVMPISGSATYSLAGATSPTFVDGLSSPGTVTGGALVVNFAPGASTVDLISFKVDMGGAGYTLDGSTTMGASTSQFLMNPSVTPSGAGSCGGSGCTSSVNGFFAGANAERVGMGYRITDDSFRSIVGAAAFKKN
jgi:hypothetical protein